MQTSIAMRVATISHAFSVQLMWVGILCRSNQEREEMQKSGLSVNPFIFLLLFHLDAVRNLLCVGLSWLFCSSSHSGFLHRMQSQIFVLMKMIFLYDNAQICAPCPEHHAEKRHGRDHEISPQVLFSSWTCHFYWKEGYPSFASGGSVAYAGLGFRVYPKPSTLGPWKCHLASSKDHAACFENRLDKKAIKNWPLL